MKSVLYIMIVLVTSVIFFSCTTDNIAEVEDLQIEVLATEGDDEQVIDEPDDD